MKFTLDEMMYLFSILNSKEVNEYFDELWSYDQIILKILRNTEMEKKDFDEYIKKMEKYK